MSDHRRGIPMNGNAGPIGGFRGLTLSLDNRDRHGWGRASSDQYDWPIKTRGMCGRLCDVHLPRLLPSRGRTTDIVDVQAHQHPSRERLGPEPTHQEQSTNRQ